jgi:hypothetical protein
MTEFTQGFIGSFSTSTRYLFSSMAAPLGIILSAILVFYLFVFIGSGLAGYARTALVVPFCAMPGVSNVLPFCDLVEKNTTGGPPRTARGPDFRHLVSVQEKTFGTLLSTSAGGSRLAFELKAAQLATTDLSTLVRVSRFVSRDRIADTLIDIANDAKLASRGLQSFEAKLGGAVDTIVAINDYAMREIEGAAAAATTLPGMVMSALARGRKAELEVITHRNFENAMDVMSINLKRLIHEAGKSLERLEELQERLKTLYDMLTQENIAFTANRDELLGRLWSQLGGNQKEKRDAVETGQLLTKLDWYRKAARAKVVETLLTLEGMEAEMDELRARVAAPALVGASIPNEVQIEAIRMGVKRLNQSRRRAKEIRDREMMMKLQEMKEATWVP